MSATTLANSIAVLAKSLFDLNPTKASDNFTRLASFVEQLRQHSAFQQPPHWMPEFEDADADMFEEEFEPEEAPKPVVLEQAPEPIVLEQAPKQAVPEQAPKSAKLVWAEAVVHDEVKQPAETKVKPETKTVVSKPVEHHHKTEYGKCWSCSVDTDGSK